MIAKNSQQLQLSCSPIRYRTFADPARPGVASAHAVPHAAHIFPPRGAATGWTVPFRTCAHGRYANRRGFQTTVPTAACVAGANHFARGMRRPPPGIGTSGFERFCGRIASPPTSMPRTRMRFLPCIDPATWIRRSGSAASCGQARRRGTGFRRCFRAQRGQTRFSAKNSGKSRQTPVGQGIVDGDRWGQTRLSAKNSGKSRQTPVGQGIVDGAQRGQTRFSAKNSGKSRQTPVGQGILNGGQAG